MTGRDISPRSHIWNDLHARAYAATLKAYWSCQSTCSLPTTVHVKLGLNQQRQVTLHKHIR
eukprot:1653509-Lingulodinium_polyedra.AAC.1